MLYHSFLRCGLGFMQGSNDAKTPPHKGEKSFMGYIFVLWGHRFDEVTATIFVTELRKARHRVKIVSLTQHLISGLYGLALGQDLTLEQALPLAHQTLCLIIPASMPGLKRLDNDPRVRDFFNLAHGNQATFIAGYDVVQQQLLPAARDNVITYPNSEELIWFAREVAGRFK